MQTLNMIKSAVSLSGFCLLILSYAIVLNPVSALEDCDFPAIFNLGDSNSDTGTLAAAFNWTPPPYGETFFHMPAGRYADGRLIIDFIAASFGLPFLSAYLNSLGSNYKHGANFASAAATIAPPQSIIPVGNYSPFYLDAQYWQFMQFKHRSQIIRKIGGIFKDLVPDEEYFGKALYTFDIGQNDLGSGFLGNMSIEEVNASVPDVVNRFTNNVKNIYKLGARSFWIHNTGPIGCLSYILASFPPTPPEMDAAGCAKRYNEVAQYFNHKLKESIVQLRKDLPLAAITYVDIYSAKYSLFTEPEKYGFELPLVACCGFGGRYNYQSLSCGSTITVNGSKIFVGSCKDPSIRVNWDGVHYTEAANKVVFDKISTGAFSDPPIPPRLACHKKLD
uniref:Alpha-L-fucosidase n=1 Tax=Davidia involucrata TaxID=16924 RepID=A0A5B6YV79_DAVIN